MAGVGPRPGATKGGRTTPTTPAATAAARGPKPRRTKPAAARTSAARSRHSPTSAAAGRSRGGAGEGWGAGGGGAGGAGAAPPGERTHAIRGRDQGGGVRPNDDGLPLPPLEDRRPDPGRARRVEMARRFVEEQHGSIASQRAC